MNWRQQWACGLDMAWWPQDALSATLGFPVLGITWPQPPDSFEDPRPLPGLRFSEFFFQQRQKLPPAPSTANPQGEHLTASPFGGSLQHVPRTSRSQWEPSVPAGRHLPVGAPRCSHSRGWGAFTQAVGARVDDQQLSSLPETGSSLATELELFNILTESNIITA